MKIIMIFRNHYLSVSLCVTINNCCTTIPFQNYVGLLVFNFLSSFVFLEGGGGCVIFV